jgi:hypothetical protein
MAASQVTRSLAGFLQFTMQIAGVLYGTKSSAVGHTDRNSQLLSELSVASTARGMELSLGAAVESTDRSLAHLVDTRVSLRAAVRSPAARNCELPKCGGVTHRVEC